MKFFDDKSKKTLHWWNRNLFFLGTILFIATNVVIFAVLQSDRNLLAEAIGPIQGNSFVDICLSLLIQISSHFTNPDWTSLLFRMLAFAFILFYLERRMGTFSLIGLVLSITAITSLPMINFNMVVSGSKVVMFALLGYMLVDYILFMFAKNKRGIANFFIGLIVLILTYASLLLEIHVIKSEWNFLPTTFSGMDGFGLLVGIILGLVILCASHFGKKSYNQKKINAVKKIKEPKKKKINNDTDEVIENEETLNVETIVEEVSTIQEQADETELHGSQTIEEEISEQAIVIEQEKQNMQEEQVNSNDEQESISSSTDESEKTTESIVTQLAETEKEESIKEDEKLQLQKQEEKTVEPKQKKVQPKKVVEEFIEQVPATEPQTQQADFELIDETNNEDEIFPEESLVEEEQPSDNKDEEPARPLTPKEELVERMKKNRMK